MARILVVDDDPDCLEANCNYLKRLGHAVECAPNGRQAIDRVLNQPPDLVILDLVMPEMDGCGLLEILRSYRRLRKLPVIILTGLHNDPRVDRARSLKANAILLKGKATIENLGDAVRVALLQPKNSE